MSASEVRSELRRYLRQRIAAGETERIVAAASAPRVAARAASASPTAPAATLGTAATTAPAASVTPPRAAAASSDALAASATAASSDSLAAIAAEVSACTRCRLHEQRKRAVPGVGPDHAAVVFVGEGPGAEEDLQGKPFVGPAGQLLTKIIQSVHFERQDVFITNIVKCRPPGNRDPQPDEVAACEPYLKRQLALLQPKVICALGRHAGAWLTGAPATMAALRTGESWYEGIRVFPTYHPAALLRNSQWKRPVWEDIQKVRAEHDRLSGDA